MIYNSREGSETVTLTYQEENALHYAADIEKKDDVQFYWCMVSAGWADNTAHTILGLIIKFI